MSDRVSSLNRWLYAKISIACHLRFENGSTDFYVFGWQDFPIDSRPIRGGMTTGIPVVIDSSTVLAWEVLQQPGLSKMERDQAAIRGLAGDFKASFDFLETLVFLQGGVPSQP